MKIRAQKGMSMIELMIAIVVIAIGIGGTTILLTSAIAADSRSNTDTTATLLAQMVLEQISAQDVNSTVQLKVTDCGGTSWNIDDPPGASGTGNGATLKSDGSIDFTQSQSTLLQHYAMDYMDCSTSGGAKIVYDVRWNVMSVSGNPSSRLITTAAKPAYSTAGQLGGGLFAIPVSLRGIGAAPAGK